MKLPYLRGSGNDTLRAEMQASLWGYDLPVDGHVCNYVPWYQALSYVEPSQPCKVGLIIPL